MRYRLMATYRGVPYEAGIGPSAGEVVLFAACPPPEELDFEPATGHWRKALRAQDVQAVWESRPTGTFRGEPCLVLDDLGDRLHIAYLGHDGYLAERLGYWQVDRGVFELVAPREEVGDIVEDRVDYPRQADTADPRAAEPAPGYPAEPAPGYPAEPAPGYPAEPAPGYPAEPAPGYPAEPAPGYPAEPAPGYPAEQARQPAAATTAEDWAPQANSAGFAAGPPDVAVVPPTSEPPLPLEAAARRAASGRARPTAPPGPQADPPNAPAPSQPEPQYRTEPPTPSGPHPRPESYPQPQPATPLQDGAQPQPATPLQDGAQPQPATPLQDGAQPQPATPLQDGAQPQPATPLQDGAQPQPATPLQDGAQRPAEQAQQAPPRRRRAARSRPPTQQIFSELAGRAAIAPDAYAIGEEVDGAMCLIRTADGFEVFNASGGSRHEARQFSDEESAYFYLFGVLAAEAVRTGRLAPQRQPAPADALHLA